MASNPASILEELQGLLAPDARGRLRAMGLSRSVVWRDGRVPDGGPNYPETLSDDLLDFGFGVLALALEVRDSPAVGESSPPILAEAFTLAAECIEAVKRRGSASDGDRGRNLVLAAAAFNLGGFAARAFTLLAGVIDSGNLASPERALALLLRREFYRLRTAVRAWFEAPRNSDASVSSALESADSPFDLADATGIALNTIYFRALGHLDTALVFGSGEDFQKCLEELATTVEHAGYLRSLPIWWVATLTKHVAKDLWEQSLHCVVPIQPGDSERWEMLRRDYIALLAARTPMQVDLWPSQLAAARRSVNVADSLVVALPTSAGKTRIAELCILRTLSEGRRIVYVTPLRALSAQVEHVLSYSFTPLGANVTALYGAMGETRQDAATVVSADIVVATPEKIDFALRQDPAVLDDVGLVVFDEGHMIGLSSREIRYEVLVQRLLRRSDAPGRRIVCLSAMFNPDDKFFDDFGNWLRRDVTGGTIHVRWRPTRQLFATVGWNANSKVARLEFIEGERPFVQRFLEERPPPPRVKGVRGGRKKPFPKDDKEFCAAVAAAFASGQQGVLVYSPQRRQIEPLVATFCVLKAQGYLGELQAPNPNDVSFATAIGREWLGDDHPAVMGLSDGVGAHHAWLPRPFQAAVEDLLRAKKLPIVVASPTLAQGVDLSCSTLVFRSILRFDGKQGLVPIDGAEFGNVVGRAGRAFVDLDGTCVFPSFKQGQKQKWEFKVFQDLMSNSRDQRMVSGLALLVERLCSVLSALLGVEETALAEYVLNHSELWSADELTQEADDLAEAEGNEDNDQQTLSELLSDLDLALLSLVEEFEVTAEDVSRLLDAALSRSLWERTLARVNDAGLLALQRQVLLSRAEWLWRNTTPAQRRACFASGLGRESGAFLYDRLDTLVAILAEFQAAMVEANAGAASSAAAAFVEQVMQSEFFVPKSCPDDWVTPLKKWVEGAAFSEIHVLDKKVAGFVRDGAGFRFVWAAEAVRVQAISVEHERSEELGDGPSLAFEYGVP